MKDTAKFVEERNKQRLKQSQPIMMSFSDDEYNAFLDLPDITSDLGRLERPTVRPTPRPTPFPTEYVSTPAPTEEPTTRPTPFPVVSTPQPVESTPQPIESTPAPSADEPLEPSATQIPIAETSTEQEESETQDVGEPIETPTEQNEVESEGQPEPQQRIYFSCPAPAPTIISSENENGNPINVIIDPPVASCTVAYDFELTVDTSAGEETGMNSEVQDLSYIQTLLPGIGDRLGESVASYLSLHTEYSDPEHDECKGYIVDEWRRRKRARLRSDTLNEGEITKIISLQSDEYTVDEVNTCTPPSRGCYLINGKLSATYVGYDEPGVKSTVSRLVRDEMNSVTPSGTDVGRIDSYTMKYLGPSDSEIQNQAPATPSAIISMEDIANAIPTEVDFRPTPIGIAIIAALTSAFVMMCYSIFAKPGVREEMLDEVQEIKGKMKQKPKRKKKVPLINDETSESDSGYDLESVAIDVQDDGEDDGGVEIMSTMSFGHDAAVQHMAREEKKSKFSLAAAVNTIPRVEPFRPSRDIRKRNSPSRVAARRSAALANEIQADIKMISGCEDVQTSADANITAFELPDPQGRRGGACTAALLEVLHKNRGMMSWVDVLSEMRNGLREKGYDQIPQLTSSNVVDVNEPMEIVPTCSGTKRAVLIGINYTGQEGELSGCHNDVKHISLYLQKVHGFKKQNMTVLLDNGKCMEPTYANIMMALEKVARESEAGDTVWLHYSGHGGRLADDSGDEEDGCDETIIPLDFKRRGQIRDDDLLTYFVKPMKKGVSVTCIMDCCHSGTVLDLPYQFIADGEHCSMESNKVFFRGLKAAETFSPSRASSSRSIHQESGISEPSKASCSPRRLDSPRRMDSYPIQKLPSVPETDLPPPTHDTPHRSKLSRLISPTSVSELDPDASIIRNENSQGEEQWEV